MSENEPEEVGEPTPQVPPEFLGAPSGTAEEAGTPTEESAEEQADEENN